jgi:pimeloyl-ACP methyl ester carboxylesterase
MWQTLLRKQASQFSPQEFIFLRSNSLNKLISPSLRPISLIFHLIGLRTRHIKRFKTRTALGIAHDEKGGLSMKSNAMAISVRTRYIYGVLAIITIILSLGEHIMAQTKSTAVVKNIVLVHGGFVDGSGWEGVYNILKKDGYTVTIVQNPTISLTDDVAITKRAIAVQNGPVILVGHSYGGAVITEAGNDPKVAGLVYIAAFALDQGESVSSLIKDPPPGAPVPPILPPVDGFLQLDKAKFPASFAGDVRPEEAEFMANSQVPWGVNALEGNISEAAWKAKPVGTC